ncbi:MAG: M23 family metallopeptidase [Woeseia sp.]
MYKPAILVPGILVLVVPAIVHAECPEDWIDIKSVRQGDTVELYAANPTEFPIALTFRAWTRNMKADRPRTVTETVPPGTSHQLIVLRKARQDRQSRYGYDCKWTVGSIDATHDDGVLYRLPYATGKSYYVLQGYGSRLSHTGREEYTVDFYMEEGTAVHAARDGIVARIEESNSKGCWQGGCAKYANYIVILHDDWTTGEYYHLQKNGALVEVGDHVVAGQKIGLSGNTGNSAMPHLHFGVYRAAPRGSYHSVPVHFGSVDGIVRKPRRGGRYPAVSIRSSAGRKAERDGNTRYLN